MHGRHRSGLTCLLLTCWLHLVQRLLHRHPRTGLLQESAGEQDIEQVYQEGVGITFNMAVEDARDAEDPEQDQDMSHLFRDAAKWQQDGFKLPSAAEQPSPGRHTSIAAPLPHMARLQLHNSASRPKGKHKPSPQPLEAPEAQPAPSLPPSSPQLAARQPQPYSCPGHPSSEPPAQPPASPQQQARSSSHGAGLQGSSPVGQRQPGQGQQPPPRPAQSAPGAASEKGPRASPPSAPPACPQGGRRMLDLFTDNRDPPEAGPGALRPASPPKSQPRSTLPRSKRLVTQEAPVRVLDQLVGNPASPPCLVRAAQLLSLSCGAGSRQLRPAASLVQASCAAVCMPDSPASEGVFSQQPGCFFLPVSAAWVVMQP